jgi:hypothetical protein
MYAEFLFVGSRHPTSESLPEKCSFKNANLFGFKPTTPQFTQLKNCDEGFHQILASMLNPKFGPVFNTLPCDRQDMAEVPSAGQSNMENLKCLVNGSIFFDAMAASAAAELTKTGGGNANSN